MNIKRLLASLVLVFFLFSSTAFAWVNLAITAAELAAPFVVSAGIKYFLPTSTTLNVPNYGSADSYGNVSRKSVSMKNGIVMAVAVGVGYAMIRDLTDKNAHPGLWSALYGISSTSVLDSGSVLTGDKIVRGDPTKYYKLNSLVYQFGWASNNPPYPQLYTATHQGSPVIAYEPGTGTVYYYSYTVLDNPLLVSPAQFANNINSGGDLKSSVVPEIDNLIQAHPELVTFPNSEVSANADSALSDGASLRQAENKSILQSRYDEALARYNANPTPENKKLLDDAKLALNQDQSNADNENATPSEVPAANYDTTIEPPEKKDIGSLIRGYIANSPFATLLNSIGFNPSGASSTVYLFDAYGESFEGDFAPYEQYFNTAGLALLSFAHIIGVFILFRKETGGD